MMKTFDIFYRFLFTSAALIFLAGPWPALAEQDWEEDGNIQVARICHIEGSLDRYDPDADEWVAMMTDAPVGINDQLFTSAGSRAEIRMPNGTLMRMNAETQVLLVSLSDQLTEIDLTSGTARLYNNSATADIIAATPYGQVFAPAGAAFDLSIGNRSVKVIAIRDSVDFSHDATGRRKTAVAGSTAVVADAGGLTTAGGAPDPTWNNWNQSQETLWAERDRQSGESVTYLPGPLHNDAYVLEANGTWQSVYYEGAYYQFWRPLHVGVHWAPFTVGTWVVWRGDRVWIPHEPFGYITHHYGNWIYTRGYWYWAPPVNRVMVRSGLPLLHIGFGWYPGRVAWISTDVQVGWIPLAPYEPYYCHYPWGRRSVVVAKGADPYHRPPHQYKHRQHTVMVHRDHVFHHDKSHYAHHKPRPQPHRPVIRPARPRQQPGERRERPEIRVSRPHPKPVRPQQRRIDTPPRRHPAVRPTPGLRSKEVRPREVRPREVRPREARPREARPREVRPREVRPREARPREARPREARPREVRPREVPLLEKQEKRQAPSRHHLVKDPNKSRTTVVIPNQRMVRTRTTKPQQQPQPPQRFRRPVEKRKADPGENPQIQQRPSTQRPTLVHKKRPPH